MALQNHSDRRAESARINGAKSQGPKTPEGIKNAKTASVQHGLYATHDTLGHLIDKELYDEFVSEMVALWQPPNAYVARRVNQLVANLWEIDRLLAVRREYLADAFTGTATTVIDMELLLSSKGDIINRLDVRLRRLNLEVSRLETDILRLKKHFATAGPSQDSLKTNDEPDETPQTAAAPPPETSNDAPEPSAPAINNPEFPPPIAEIRPIM
jgi:hypothetical protein